MSDPIQRSGGGARDPSRRRNWFSGRSNRKEYWLYIAIVIALIVALQLLKLTSTQTGASSAIFLVQIRRFHDLGRSGWWAVVLMVAEIAIAVGLLVTLSMDAAMAIAGLLGVIPIVVLGVIPGQPFENRFGPSPGQKPLADVFS